MQHQADRRFPKPIQREEPATPFELPVSRRSRPSIVDSGEVENTPPPSARAESAAPPGQVKEGFAKRFAAVGGVVSLACGLLGVGYGWRSSQATVTADGMKPIVEQLQKIDNRLTALEITNARVGADIEWIKRTLASLPAGPTAMNVTAHQPQSSVTK